MPFGQVRTDVSTPNPQKNYTDFSYTGQRSVDLQGSSYDLGLMDYKARFYDPYLNRFQQPDSITPGGPQGLNRYAYGFNNPIRYNDPTGHGPCDGVPDQHKQQCLDLNSSSDSGGESICDAYPDSAECSPYVPNRPKTEDNPDVVYILICGNDMYDDCETSSPLTSMEYYFSKPLSPYQNWAVRTGMPYYYFSTGNCNGKGLNCYSSLQGQIVDQMMAAFGEDPTTQFAVIGFSGGAPMATWVAQGALNAGISGNQLTVVELDGMLNSTHNKQSDINNLIRNGVTFVAIDSVPYRQDPNHQGIALPVQSIPSTAPRHTALANDLYVFLFVRSYFP